MTRPGDFQLNLDAHPISSSIDANNINLFFGDTDPSGKPLYVTRDTRSTPAYECVPWDWLDLSGTRGTSLAAQPPELILRYSAGRSIWMLQISLKVSSSIIPLHVYGRTAVDVPRVKAKAVQVQNFLHRMPAAHRSALYPIFVVDRKPGGIAKDGGYWTPGEVHLWLGREHNTGVPDADIRTYVLSRGETGIIAMTATAWESPNFERALFHEIAHCLDTTLGITPERATVNDYLGVPNPGANRVGEFAAQAYQRFILGRMICQQPPLPADQSLAAATARVVQLLRRSPAFRSLPANWQPGDG